MVIRENKQFAQKHKSGLKPDNLIKAEILNCSVKGKLPCFVAFKIATKLRVSPGDVRKTVDLLNFRLAKCQLGLYGYQPKKKKVKPKMPLDQSLKNAITDAVVDGKLSCKKVWEIASLCNVHKLRVSCACEAMKIKIIKCQLGAF
ncbi:MAG: hypothetical protein H8E80_08865 [Desulfobacteraceae bacterium]|uniref:Uncharacterized protein n=1 Tax=Candidatus Desulfaltia bathyphila TaxID=2841697 RepID=A0A8J6N803_9BACT|nr:hypothetical protein [Candidatus Desulfaltia bathyphila]MBL7196072.1 hypothetical protein [Desulfobacterales bacterium]